MAAFRVKVFDNLQPPQIKWATQMEKLRTVSYTSYLDKRSGEGFFAKLQTEERKGVFHGIVHGKATLNGTGQDAPYDYGLIEDSETKKLVKVELSFITFTDKTTPDSYGEL